MQKLFYRRLHDCGNVRDGADRTGLHREPVYRQVLQSYGNVGQVPQGMAQDHAPNLLPVSSRPDGRRAWCHVPGTVAEGNMHIAKGLGDSSLPFYIFLLNLFSIYAAVLARKAYMREHTGQSVIRLRDLLGVRT